MPYQIINGLAAGYAPLSDAEVLAALSAIPALADESDPCWNEDKYWHQVAYPYLALWDVVAERQLRSAIPLILDRAASELGRLRDPAAISAFDRAAADSAPDVRRGIESALDSIGD